MSKIFVKKSDLTLVNGGYVVSGEKQTPVFNADFIAAQKHAEWVVTLAEKAKGKDFEGKVAYTIAELKADARKALGNNGVEYVPSPKKVKYELTDKLKKEAMDFINNDKETSKVAKVNEFLQQFNTIQEFEEFGLYFEEDICKLNKVYTIEEIVSAVTSVIDFVD